MVQKGKLAACAAELSVRALNKVLFPTFGSPIIPVRSLFNGLVPEKHLVKIDRLRGRKAAAVRIVHSYTRATVRVARGKLCALTSLFPLDLGSTGGQK